MPNSATLPVEFAALVDKVQYVQQKNENEFSSSCPQCGGEVHQDGSWPDRFVMWRSSRRGEPFGMCMRGHCGHKWSTHKQDAAWTLEEREEITRKQLEVEAAYNARVEARLTELSAQIETSKAYLRYHDEGMENQVSLDYWQVRGIPEEWQRYLMLGCIQDYRVTGKLSTYESVAFTIPIWSEVSRIENIKLRVANPLHDNDRYRNYYKSGSQHLYKPLHKTSYKQHAILLEGEIKAAVALIRGNCNQERYDIYGVQSKQPEARLLKKLESFDCVYIAFDPDAYRRAQYIDRGTGEVKDGKIAVVEVAKQIGLERVRFVLPPRGIKFDDAILQGYNFANAVRMAIKPERLDR